jgi:stearoyl-CoA desaturase (delta-9 desaturase)
MGWILYKDAPELQSFGNVLDLKTKPLVVWQHRYYLPLVLVSCFLLPVLIGLRYGRPGGSVLWGGLLRVVLFHHITFLVNSASHTIGSQPYSRADSSRDNWWLAFLMFGGGYHNFHHTFPGDYRSGIAWYHWDPVKWWVWGLQWIGLTWRLKRTPKQAILRTQQRMRYTTGRLEPEQPPEERNDQWQHQI